MSRIAFAALLLLIGAAMHAQEFDIFELSDFLDPRIRGAAYLDNGLRIRESGHPFLVTRVSIGAVADYYWRTTPTGADVALFHNATSLYWGANQLNLKLTHLETSQEDALLPETRGVLQFARYTARPDPDTEDSSKREVMISRYLVGVALEESPDALENLDGHRSLNYELAAEVDTRIPLTRFIATFSYVKRFAGEGQSTERFAYVFHTSQYEYRQLSFDMNLAVGAAKTDGWSWGHVRPAFRLRVPLDKVGTVIHAAYAPTMSFEGGFEARHEIALFVDRALFARVFMPAGKKEE